MAQDQITYPDRLVYALFYEGSNSWVQRLPYYTFQAPPDTIVDGYRQDFNQIINHQVLGIWIGDRKSGANLTATFNSGWINGSVTNTAVKEITEPHVRVYRISQADMVEKPNEVTEIIAEIPLVTLQDTESDTFSAGGGLVTLAADEYIVVFVQDDATKEVFHALYLPTIP